MDRVVDGRWMAAATAVLVLAAAGVAQAVPLPRAVTHGDVTYVSGGIGELETKAMRRMESRYPVTMMFLAHNQGTNEFVAGVELRVTDRDGNAVVDLGDGGPMLLLKVPDGKYTVRAEYEGRIETRMVDVTPGHHEHVEFLWS